ncbi:uncharacterized protein LOC121867516 [Homarus americanus]|uniref:uncharacterized protein LOC121867516 n=1 Tax=Homarus americanus TaxID=6706 RepID=UPI001C45B857|nr:uncharacterized protein LOC121867516 [Homarus americanus]
MNSSGQTGCVAVKMIRRGSGRTPPFIVVGLVIIILIFGFNYWTLSSQNADAQQELEKLQAEIKISAMKQEQSDNKNAALQETVHEMDGLSAKLKKKLEEGENFLKNKEQDNSKKTYEITDLKNKLIKMQERIETLAQQIEDRDADLVKAKDTHLRLVTERDDAVEAIAEKDTLINTLKRQLEQVTVKRTHLTISLATCNSELVALKKECEEIQSASDGLADIVVQTKRDVEREFEAKMGTVKEQLAEEKSRNGILKTNVDSANVKIANTVAELTECQDNVSKLKASAVAHEADHTKAKDEAAAVQREKMAVAQPNIVPGPMNLPNIENREPYYGPGQLGYVRRGAVNTRDKGMQGITFHREIPIVPRDPPNAPRKKPRFSVADMPKEPAAAQNAPVANAIQDSGVRDTLIAPQPVNSVLPVDRNPQPVEQLNPNEGNPQIQPPAGRYIIPAPIQEFHGLAKPRFSKVTQAHVLQQPQVKPVQGPAVVERPAPPVAENNQPIAAPVNPAANPEGQDPHNDVLAPPPQHNEAQDQRVKDIPRDKRDNLDAAIDEEEKIVEDLMDDQDEEGNEVKHNNENVDEDNGQEDNKDLGRSGNLVGAVEVPQQFHQQEDTHQDMNLGEDLTNQGNYYETNLDNNIRNLRRPPELH